MAKNDSQKAIFPVLPMMPQVTKENTMISQQGAINLRKKQIISITMKTMLSYFEIFKREIILPDWSSALFM